MNSNQDLINKALEEADADIAAEKKAAAESGKTPEELKVEAEAGETEKKAAEEKAAKEKETPSGKELTDEQKKEEEKVAEEKKAEEEKIITEKAKTEGKKEGEKIADTKIKEEAKKAWWETTEKKEETPAPEVDKDTKTKLSEYDKLLADPDIKMLIEAKKAGKTLRSFVSELKGTDPNTLSPKELYELKIKKYNLSDEEYKEHMEKFDDLLKDEQITATQGVKNELLKEQDERLSKFSTEGTEEAKKEEEKIKYITDKATTDLDNFIKDIEGKELLGVEMTPEVAKDVKAHATKGFTIYNEDGTYNIEKLTKHSLFDLYPDKVMEENIERATGKGQKQILDDVTRASTNDGAINRLPDLAAAAEEDVKNAEKMAARGNPLLNGTPIPTN